MTPLLALALALTGPAHGSAPDPTTAPDYRDGANWLCRPGRDDACTQDLTATVIAADGTRTVEPFVAAADPKFDCFYVYPTISLDAGGNSDLVPGPEERRVIQLQAARFRSVCRVYAPVYRQVTLTALRALMGGGTPAIDRDLTVADVKAAWDDYLEHDNKGRGVVLIGHSQGALVLTQLIGREVQGKPAQKQLISAMLIGSSIPVLDGKDTGLFDSIPLCRAADQTGCIVTYASFRQDFPPPADSRFGRGDRPGTSAGCTNPAALGGGLAVMDSYLSSGGGLLGMDAPPEWTKDGAPVKTPFVKVPGLLSAQCATHEGATYLAVTVNADPADPRTDAIEGDVKVGAQVLRSWGLHLIDMDLAIGNLTALAETQAKVWAAKRGE